MTISIRRSVAALATLCLTLPLLRASLPYGAPVPSNGGLPVLTFNPNTSATIRGATNVWAAASINASSQFTGCICADTMGADGQPGGNCDADFDSSTLSFDETLPLLGGGGNGAYTVMLQCDPFGNAACSTVAASDSCGGGFANGEASALGATMIRATPRDLSAVYTLLPGVRAETCSEISCDCAYASAQIGVPQQGSATFQRPVVFRIPFTVSEPGAEFVASLALNGHHQSSLADSDYLIARLVVVDPANQVVLDSGLLTPGPFGEVFADAGAIALGDYTMFMVVEAACGARAESHDAACDFDTPTPVIQAVTANINFCVPAP